MDETQSRPQDGPNPVPFHGSDQDPAQFKPFGEGPREGPRETGLSVKPRLQRAFGDRPRESRDPRAEQLWLSEQVHPCQTVALPGDARHRNRSQEWIESEGLPRVYYVNLEASSSRRHYFERSLVSSGWHYDSIVRVPAVIMFNRTSGQFTPGALYELQLTEYCSRELAAGNCDRTSPVCCLGRWWHWSGDSETNPRLQSQCEKRKFRSLGDGRPLAVARHALPPECEHTNIYAATLKSTSDAAACSGVPSAYLSIMRALRLIIKEHPKGRQGRLVVICEDDALVGSGFLRRYREFLRANPLPLWYLAKLHGTITDGRAPCSKHNHRGLDCAERRAGQQSIFWGGRSPTLGTLAILLHSDNASHVLRMLSECPTANADITLEKAHHLHLLGPRGIIVNCGMPLFTPNMTASELTTLG